MKEDLQGGRIVGVVVEFTRLIDISRASHAVGGSAFGMTLPLLKNISRAGSATARRCGGFTLLELIMVVVLAGIMAAVAVPKLSGVSAIDVSAVARQVQSDIRYTQELAMSKYRGMMIKFTSEGNTYEIKYANPESLVESKSLPARSKAKFVSGYTLTFKFNSLGEPFEGGDGTLRISSRGINKDIKVEARTGKATIQ